MEVRALLAKVEGMVTKLSSGNTVKTGEQATANNAELIAELNVIRNELANSNSEAEIAARLKKEIANQVDAGTLLPKETFDAKLKEIAAAPPDLVLLDVMMPGMDGFEILLKIKSQPKTKGIPVLMCTALNAMNDVEKCCAWGAAGYITKPFDLNRVLAKVNACLGTPPSAAPSKPA